MGGGRGGGGEREQGISRLDREGTCFKSTFTYGLHVFCSNLGDDERLLRDVDPDEINWISVACEGVRKSREKLITTVKPAYCDHLWARNK